MRVCSKCKVEKPLDQFYRQGQYGHQRWCKLCSNGHRWGKGRFRDEAHKERVLANNRASYARNKAKYQRQAALRKYGLTGEEYDSLSTQCEICGSENDLGIDHCHMTTRVRGRLCKTCNSGLGMFRDNEELLERAVLYLNKAREAGRR